MPITNTTVTVGGAATLLATGSGPLASPAPVTVYNKGVAAVFYGGPGVTSDTGVAIASGAVKEFTNLADGEVLYAAVATATQTVSVVKGRQ